VEALRVRAITKKKTLAQILVLMNLKAKRNLVRRVFLGTKWRKERKWKTGSELKGKLSAKIKTLRKRDDLIPI
jgi:hypothetical protein